MSMLETLSGELAAAVDAAGPSVVRVETGRRWPAGGTVWDSGGVILTTAHAIDDDGEVSIGLPDGTAVPATLVGRDPSTDVAVLRASASGLSPAQWIDPEGLRVGQVVLALARPGRTIRARLGIVSALGGPWRTPGGTELNPYLESDVRMGVGFSGGPLVTTAGKALGMNTRGVLPRTPLAITTVTLRDVIGMLLTHGHIRRGYLGLAAHPVRLPKEAQQQTGQEIGLIVVGVEPDSPAGRAGLLVGDIITAVDSQPVRSLLDLRDLLGVDRIGATIQLRLVRAGQIHTVAPVVGERRRRTA